MEEGDRRKIIRLLGVGFDAQDDHVRITKGEKFDVIMGSEQSHEYLRDLIEKIEKGIDDRGLSLDKLTPDEFARIVESLI